MEETAFADNDYVLFIFSKKITFSLKKKTTLQKKLSQLRKKQTGINVDGSENLEDLPKLLFTDEECGILKFVAAGGKLARNINKRKKPMFYKPVDIHFVTNAVANIVS